MAELDVNWLIGTLIGVVALGFTITFLFINYTYKKKTDQKSEIKQDNLLVTKLAQDAKHEQQELAKEVKEEFHVYVNNRIDTVNLRIDNEVRLADSKRDLLETRIDNNCKEIEDIKALEKENISRVEKSIYFLQQFQWGKDAKSIAPYTVGEEETQAHKEEENTGIFAPTEGEKEERERERERRMNKYNKEDN